MRKFEKWRKFMRIDPDERKRRARVLMEQPDFFPNYCSKPVEQWESFYVQKQDVKKAQ